MIETTAVLKRQIDWIPDEWSRSSRRTATIQDGILQEMSLLDYCFVQKDIDGAIEFLKAIKEAMTETSK